MEGCCAGYTSSALTGTFPLRGRLGFADGWRFGGGAMRPSRHCERSAAIQRVTRGGGWIAAEAVPSRNDGERGGCGGVLRRRVALRQLRRVQESAPYGVFAGDASASGLPRRLRLLAMTGSAGRLWKRCRGGGLRCVSCGGVQESAPYGVFAGDASAGGLPRRLRLLAMTGVARRWWKGAALATPHPP